MTKTGWKERLKIGSILRLDILFVIFSEIKLRLVFPLLGLRGVELLVKEGVDDGGEGVGGVEVEVVAALHLPVHEVGVVAPEHAVDAGVDLLGHVARALRGLDHQVGALHLG